MKKEEIDFHRVPFDYALCLAEACSKGDECLRRLAAQSMPAEKEYWNIVSPKRLAALKGDCPYFRTSRKARYAKGCMAMLDNLPYNKRKTIVLQLMAHFGQRTYYRVRKGERLLNPDEQQAVLDIIGRHHADTPADFDAYVEDLVW